MKRALWCRSLACLGLLLGGCNTVQGVGKDIQKGGQIIQNAGKK
ncbi:MAG: entericidin A/B family lipoprotein [Tepidimonas sp.]